MSEKYNMPKEHSLGSMEGIQPETDNSERFKIHPERFSRLSPEDQERVASSLLRNIASIEEMVPGANVENIPTFENNIAFSENVPGRSDPINTPYSSYAIDLVLKLDEENLERMRESFKDKVVVDIGAGSSLRGYNLSCYLNAKGYIAVEPFHARRLFQSMLAQEDNKKRSFKSSFSSDELTSIPLNIVSEDGISFLKRLPDNSAVVFTFGIEPGAVICDKQYVTELINEVSRVTVKDGYTLTANSLVNTPIGSATSEMFACRDIRDNTSIRKIKQGSSEQENVEVNFLK